jgi:hypothetical protein
MRAWLQRHIHSRPTRVLSAIGQRRPLSMQIPKLSVKPLANHLAITHNDSPHERIRTDPPPPILRQPKCPQQVPTIRSCQRSIHID